MESKIILSLSSLRADARSYRYKCPDNTLQHGCQTNEAPVKYLLKKNPSIGQILCLVTPTARNTALKHFQSEIKKVAPAVKIVCIDAPDTGKLPDEVITELTKEMQKGDTVYLDSSGGTRYTIMGLLQIVRILEFKGIRLGQVVYANLSSGQGPTIDDVTDLYLRLDLISGMHELAAFGNVQTLRSYFRKNTSPDGVAIVALLNAIDQMTDAITLCRLNSLKQAVNAYQDAIAQAQSIRDPIMRELIEILQEKFGHQVDTPWLIRWCLDHQMLTQALSLYREWMPAYILNRQELFSTVPSLPGWWHTNVYQDRHVFLWSWMMNLALPEKSKKLDMNCTVKTIRELENWLPKFGWAVGDIGKVRRMAWDFQYIQGMRNMVLHGNETAALNYHMQTALEEEGYDTHFERMSASDMIQHIRNALKHAQA